MEYERSVSLRIKIKPNILEDLDNIRKTQSLSMNEAINLTLTNALDATGKTNNDSNNNK